VLASAAAGSGLTQPGEDTRWHMLSRARALAALCRYGWLWRPGQREEFMSTVHFSCPLARSSRRSDSERTSAQQHQQ